MPAPAPSPSPSPTTPVQTQDSTVIPVEGVGTSAATTESDTASVKEDPAVKGAQEFMRKVNKDKFHKMLEQALGIANWLNIASNGVYSRFDERLEDFHSNVALALENYTNVKREYDANVAKAQSEGKDLNSVSRDDLDLAAKQLSNTVKNEENKFNIFKAPPPSGSFTQNAGAHLKHTLGKTFTEVKASIQQSYAESTVVNLAKGVGSLVKRAANSLLGDESSKKPRTSAGSSAATQSEPSDTNSPHNP